MTYEKLKATLSPWDSDLWGFKIGKLEAKGVVPVAFVREANPDFDVVFVKTTGWHEEKKGKEALDWRFDMEALYPPHKTIGDDPTVVGLEGPLPAHLEIAATAFVDSRFSRDPQLAPKVQELYRRWVTSGGQLWAMGGQQKEDGFLVQTYDEDNIPRISLIGVAEKYRGLGLGERLVLGVMNKFENTKAWRVTVAVRNWRAIRFYEGLGFRVKEVTTAFHVWI